MILSSLFSLTFLTSPGNAVRFVKASSCEATSVKLAVGMSTQIIFEEAPILTYNGDEQTFSVRTTEEIPRSVVLKPNISPDTVAQLVNSHQGRSSKSVAAGLNQTYSTNLFVFFKNSNQLLFKLELVDKSAADNIIRVKQEFRKDCNL